MPITGYNQWALQQIQIHFRERPPVRTRVDTGYFTPEQRDTVWVRAIRAMLWSNVDLVAEISFEDGTVETYPIVVTPGKTKVYTIPLRAEEKGGLPRVQIYTSGTNGFDALLFADGLGVDIGFECYWIEYKVEETGNDTDKRLKRVVPM